MNALGQSAFLKALGWALLDSIWQFGVLFLLLLFFLFVKKGLSSSHKHGLSLLLLFAGTTWSVLGFFKYYYNLETFSMFELAFQDSPFLSALYTGLRELAEGNINYISLLYLLAVSALSIRFLRYFFHFRKIRYTGITKLRAGLRLQVQQLAAQLGITRNVQVWVSSLVDTPMIIGFFKPTILMPVASINYLSVQQLEAILLHELAHIKRNDYLINLFVITLEILFFFNPFARLLIRSIKQERENSCDDWVLQFRFDPHQYASALLTLEQERSSYLSAAIAATGKSKTRLLHRVQRIMQVKSSNDYRFPYFSYLLVSAIVLLAVFMNGTAVVRDEAMPEPDRFRRVTALMHPRTGKESPPALIVYTDAVQPVGKKDVPVPAAKKHVAENNNIADRIAVTVDPLSVYINTLIRQSNEPASFLAGRQEPEKEFSIPDEEEAPVPPAAVELQHFPFVPGSSFSINITDDTTKPKVKTESYHERIARESLEKAKLAVERIDWKKIEKELKTAVNIEKLRKEIEQSLEELNWKAINDEVRSSIDEEDMEEMKSSLRKDYEEMKRFKLQQEQYRLIQKDLQKKQEQYKREAEKHMLDIQQHLRENKVVVHI